MKTTKKHYYQGGGKGDFCSICGKPRLSLCHKFGTDDASNHKVDEDTGAEAPSVGKYENWPVQKLEGDALDVTYGGREVPPLQGEVFRLRWKMNEVIGRVNYLYKLLLENDKT